ncbi:MAG: Maf family protein [Tissierellia bacterium]|nr:Maf family protein [Tissierellia bacterium]
MIILASKSPRRKEILDEFITDYKIITEKTKETIDLEKSPIVNCMSLAFEKAIAVAINYPMHYTIGADTIVINKGKILGKPKDYDDAYNMLTSLSDNKHKVITAFAIVNLEKNIKIIDYDVSKVRFKKIDKKDLERYLKTNEPYDKAGSYAIQGEASKFVANIEGSYKNIIGFPVEKFMMYYEKLCI